MFLFLLLLPFHSCSFFLPFPSLSSPLLSLLSLFSLFLGDYTKWPTRVDMSLNPGRINQSKGAGERAHLCSLIWTFSVHRHILQYPLILQVDNKGPEQPEHSSRLIRAFVACNCIRALFCALYILKFGYSLEVPQKGAFNSISFMFSWNNKKVNCFVVERNALPRGMAKECIFHTGMIFKPNDQRFVKMNYPWSNVQISRLI